MPLAAQKSRWRRPLYSAAAMVPASNVASISTTECVACADDIIGGGLGGFGGGDGGGGEYMATVAASTEGEMMGTDQLRM